MANGVRITTFPCKAFGHNDGRYWREKDQRWGDCLVCARLHTSIGFLMYYWGKRMILGLASEDCFSVPRRVRRAQRNLANRKYYARRRAAGMSSAAAKCQTFEQVRANGRKVRERWGGQPGHIGSPAWLRREIARTPWAIR